MTTKQRPALTIGIPTYNRAESLRSTLSLLAPVADGAGGAIDILVVDNGSTDTTPAVVAAYEDRPWLHAHRNAANLGCDANYLRVVELARGEWCWLIGDDERLDAGAIPHLVERLRTESADAVFLAHRGSPVGDAPLFYDKLATFLSEFRDIEAFAVLACHTFRTDAARPFLIEAYRSAGLLHAYVTIALLLLARGNGVRVYADNPVLKPAVRAPRWNFIDGYLGAWLTFRGVSAPDERRLVDAREGFHRARRIGVSAILDILGLQNAGLRPGHLATMASIFPARYYRYLLAAPAALALSRFPAFTAPVLRQATHIPRVARVLSEFGVDLDASRQPGRIEQGMEASRQRRRGIPVGDY